MKVFLVNRSFNQPFRLLWLMSGSCLLALASVLSLQAQQLKYDVYLNEKKVGLLEAKRTAKDGIAQYLIQSNVNFRMMFKLNLNHTFESTYQNDMLIKASTRSMMNDNVKATSKVTWNGTFYQLEVKDEHSVLKNSRIIYSMVLLYFREPRQITQVFSERYGVFLTIKPLAEHRYELLMPDGKKNYYSYRNGVCYLVEVQHTVGQIVFKLIGAQ